MKKSILFYALLLIGAGSVFTSCQKIKEANSPASVDSLKVGLIAYYPFNNTGADSSGLGNDGFVHSINSTSNRFGKPNSAYYFDGVSSYIQVADNQALRLNNTDFTINTWVKVDSYNPSYGSIILGKRGAGNNNGWNYGIHGYAAPGTSALAGQVTYQVSGGNDPYAAGNKVISTGSWYMLTAVYDYKAHYLTFYVNGFLDNTTTSIPVPSATANGDVFIGRDNPLVGPDAYYFKGALDDIRIYNRALAKSEIQKLFLLLK